MMNKEKAIKFLKEFEDMETKAKEILEEMDELKVKPWISNGVQNIILRLKEVSKSINEEVECE